MVSKEFLGPANKNFVLAVSRECLQFEFQLGLIFTTASLVSEVRKLGSSEPMTFAIFQAFEVIRLFTIFRLFDNFLTDLLIAPLLPPSTS